jgi:hypothetical protein
VKKSASGEADLIKMSEVRYNQNQESQMDDQRSSAGGDCSGSTCEGKAVSAGSGNSGNVRGPASELGSFSMKVPDTLLRCPDSFLRGLSPSFKVGRPTPVLPPDLRAPQFEVGESEVGSRDPKKGPC